ncbi:MAG: hypothetical protein ACRD3G_11400 [Vicinamibacterales bacterium]
MSVRYIQKLNRLSEMQSFPNAAGIGVFGGALYMDFGGGPVPIAQVGVGGSTLVVNPDISGAYATIQDAVDDMVSGDRCLIAPGAYDETVTVGRTDADGAARSNLSFVGMGGRGSVFIEPSTEDASGFICHADDVQLVNVGCAGEDETSAIALTVTGTRFRAYGCKFEGGLSQLVIGPGTVAQEAAGTRGRGADGLFVDCEFAWGTNGVVLTASDFGAVTQIFFRGCKFHNLTAAAFEEAGGTVSIRFRNLEIADCTFDDLEGGTAPTKYISLNDDNGNDGVVTNCRFPTAINSGLNLVSTALHWVSNFHTGGVSAAQPS